ncbi:MAG: TonB-dependent receptor [Pseudomonadota bacterium]
MKLSQKLAAGAAVSALSVFYVGAATAQETSSAIRGTVVAPDGTPVAGTEVTITDTRTGSSRTVTTANNGSFSARGLRVGGPYTVEVDSATFADTTVSEIFLDLGDTYSVVVALQDDVPAADEIIITASALETIAVAVGPSATFDAEALRSLPAINRNLSDILRTDPRIFVDESRGDINAVQCGGKNNRFNSLTLDGVRLNDNFGLNANGFPTERIPFSFDAIEQVAVELAPFDVEYGGFSACNINAVTKSGTNEISGGAFFDFTSDSLRGDSLEGEDIESGDFNEWRYGANIGGPIIKDRVFLFAAYEKLEGANLFDRGPLGSGAVNEVDITQEEVDEILRIARDVYNYDPGEIPSSFDNEDEKILVKLDANITDRHRGSFTFNHNDGFNITESDGDNDELEFSNHLYERGAKLNSYVGSLYSDWTDNFSTELRIGYSKLKNRVNTIGGTDFGEITIETDDVDVYLGGDDSRQANQLTYDTFNIAAKAFYALGAHNFTFGFERESLDVFNLFVQHVETEIDFDRNPPVADPLDTRDPAIVNFELGLADNVNYNNAPSGDPRDAAADWAYSVNTIYAQDEFDFGNGLTVIAGLRYDWYTTSDEPVTNPDFLADYGFSNGQTLDGEGLFQPRLAFQWDATPSIDVRGGVGLYSGGNPNVWLSNTYSANNVLQFGSDGGAFGFENGVTSLFDIEYGRCEDGVPEGPGYCVPQEMIDAVAAGSGSNFEINYLDPDFEIPSEWKFALGATFLLDAPVMGEFVLNADVLYTLTQDSAVWIRGDFDEPTGTATGPDGQVYPTYTSVREGAFVLTNSPNNANSLLLSGSIAKQHDFGLEWSAGYAYSDAEDVHPMTSSVAFSNYSNRAFIDPQDTSAATSDYNTKHRFTGVATYKKAFFGDNNTTLSAFGQVQSGRPYSLVADIDPNSITGFTPFLEDRPFLAAGASRNGETGSWWGKVDLRFEQEIPGVLDGHKAAAFIVIDNFTNLLNDEWGILREPGFPPQCRVNPDGSEAQPCESRIGDASRYEIRFGMRYDF